jgi:hypothetical protein
MLARMVASLRRMVSDCAVGQLSVRKRLVARRG